MIHPQTIERIFDAAAIEEVVGEYVNLKKAGANYRGLCPFHDDKNPSMSVSPSKGIYKCFSCGKGGNAVQFIMEHEGLSYPMALKFLADKYHIEIDEDQFDVKEIEEESRIKDGLFSCLEFAKNDFIKQLNDTDEGRRVYKSYLKERGIREESLEKFQIGLSGLERQYLLHSGMKQGYSPEQLYQAGLVKKQREEEGVIESNLRDTFIERIVFPIHNISGKVLGFGGRIIKSDVKAPKYLNSPETKVYEKRKVLYGLYQAKNAIRKEDRVFLVEGYLDVISLSQAGIENVVAVSGTAFTEEQAKLLKRFCSHATLLFDGDEAGINASLKHIQTLIKAGFSVDIALFEDGEDPDSYVQKHGTDGFNSFVETGSKNFVQFIASTEITAGKEDPIEKAQAVRKIAEHISLIQDPLSRMAFINQTSKLLDFNERLIIDEVNKMRGGARIPESSVPDFPPPPIEEPVDTKNYQEYDLLKSLILYADREFDEDLSVAQFIFNELNEEELWPETEPYAEIFRQAYAHFEETGSLNELYFIRLPEASKFAADFLSSKYQLSEHWETDYEKFIPTDDKNYKKQVIENLNYLKLQRIEQAILDNQEKLKVAEDEEEVLILQNIHKQLHELRQKIANEIGAVVLK
ncbi:DNA primase [bacterium]|nr:DNA primase [bacterium]